MTQSWPNAFVVSSSRRLVVQREALSEAPGDKRLPIGT
jgi:hypothetical protein